MPSSNVAADFVKRHPAASALASVTLAATAVFTIFAANNNNAHVWEAKTKDGRERGYATGSGNLAMSGSAVFGGTVTANGVLLGSGGAGGGRITGTGANTQLAFFNNTSGVNLSGASLTSYTASTGNISIGKTGAGKAKLDVVGTMSGNVLNVSSGGYILGRLGVKKTTPGAQIDIVGESRTTLGIVYSAPASAAFGDAGYAFQVKSNGGTDLMHIDSLGNIYGSAVGIQLTSSSVTYFDAGYSTNGIVMRQIATNVVGLQMKEKSSATSDVFQVTDSSGNAYFKVVAGGNVGIGKSSAATTAKLDVVGTISGSALTIDSALGTSNTLGFGNVGIGTLSPAAALQITTPATGTVGLLIKSISTSQTADLLSVQTTGGATAMAVTKNQAVSIGTPSSNLAASNYLLINTSATQDSNANIQFNTDSTGRKLLVLQGLAGQTGDLQEWQRSNGNVLSSISASGSGSFSAIAIGKATPVSGRPLEVEGTISGSQLHIYGDAITPQVITIPLCDATSSCITGSGSAFMVPRTMNNYFLSGATIYAAYSGTTGTMTVQLRNKTQATDMFTTFGLGSTRTISGSVVNASNNTVTANDVLVPNITAIHTTPAKGASINLMFYPK